MTWRARVDPASSYPYFENEATGQTQWADPREAVAEASEAAEPEVVEVAEDEDGARGDRARAPRSPRRPPRRPRRAPAEAPAPAPKKNTPTRDWARKTPLLDHELRSRRRGVVKR